MQGSVLGGLDLSLKLGNYLLDRLRWWPRNHCMESPRTLQEAILYFNDFENCKTVMMRLRWPDGIVKCPRCGSEKVFWIEKERVWKCYGKHDHAKFSLKTGTSPSFPQPIEHEHLVFMSAAKLLEDTRLAPGEKRTESFTFAIPAGSQTRVTATLRYFYSQFARTESQKPVAFLSLTGLVP